MIVHILDQDGLEDVAASIPPVARELAASWWPGPLTLVVPRGPRIPPLVTAGLDSVAVRAPSHPVARALLASAGFAVAAPSANLFGRTSPTTASHVLADLGEYIDVVLDGGATPVGIESTVIDCRTHPPLILRPGGMTLEELSRLLPDVRLAERIGQGPQPSPGRLGRHYAPRARLILVLGAEMDIRAAITCAAKDLAAARQRVGLLVAEEDLLSLSGLPAELPLVALARMADSTTAARRLFGALRQLDAAGVQAIVARDFGTEGLALAVRDRLTKAAEGNVVHCTDDEAASAAAIVRLVGR